MLPVQIIQKKRDKYELTRSEITFFIESLVKGEVSESQAGAFLMASYLNGLSPIEIAALTESMANSGEKLQYPRTKRPIADKHSTGGVGDKISLLLLPICTACGLDIPMISGRGLAHTGGTLDKLESIVGFDIHLSQDAINTSMKELGGFIIGQSADIAPADKLLYQIRDVTATVDSIGLITASILSKKLAEGLDVLVLDLKTGSGAFMRSLDDAYTLGNTMKATAEQLGLKMKVILTRMDSPLGRTAGNWLEMKETEECLMGDMPDDIRRVTYKLISEMLIAAGIVNTEDAAEVMISHSIKSGAALNNFYKFVQLQGGDWQATKSKYADTKFIEIKSSQSGYVQSINALQFGEAGILLGAGRKTETDAIDYAAGFEFLKKCGDAVELDEPLYRIYFSDEALVEAAAKYLHNAYTISTESVEIPDLIVDVI